MKNFLLSLKHTPVIILTTIVISLIVASTCRAQSFTNVPNDSIIGTGTMDLEEFYDILQKDNSSDTILLHWEKVSSVLPDQWIALICDNNACYGSLLQGGNMLPVDQGQDGMLSVHVTPHVNAGMAIIRYAVWDISNAALKDTLTFIITAYQTGINSLNQNPTVISVSGNELVVQKNDPQLTHLRVCNLEGRILLESSLPSNNMLFDVSNFPTGIYFVEASGTNSIFTRKILIQ